MGELINGRTKDEIITGLKCEVPCHKCAYKDHNFMKDDSCSYYVEQDIIALIERLEAERDAALAKVPKWISVKEHPPEFPCLYWDGINQIGITKSLATITLKSGKTVYLSDMFLRAFPDIKQSDVDSCTHILYWMPLPQPPEEDAHE